MCHCADQNVALNGEAEKPAQVLHIKLLKAEVVDSNFAGAADLRLP